MTERSGVAVVTGASAGVGRATAIALAQKGFDIALLARGAAGLEAAATEVRKTGRQAICVPTDVSQFDQVAAAADRIESELGPIELWVNSAMTTVFAPLRDVAPEEFQRAVEVTFLGHVWGTMVALERMRPRDRGTIINVGSALAYLGIPLQSAYCAAKFASRGFFESVRGELIHEGSNIRMGMVHLPAVNTPQFDWCLSKLPKRAQPVPPIYQPEVAARAIVHSALTGRRSKVLGSWNKAIVVMSHVSPAIAHHFAANTAADSQLGDEDEKPGRPANLHEPLDGDRDWTAHGSFDDKARGFFDPSFLVTLPSVVGQLGVATYAAAKERVRAISRPGG